MELDPFVRWMIDGVLVAIVTFGVLSFLFPIKHK